MIKFNIMLELLNIQVYCAGSPLVLSLLAPLLADRGGRKPVDPHRWEHYIGKLRDRKYTQMRRQSSPYSYETINEAIAISFDNLDAETRCALNDFVIFLDDVNIPAKVPRFVNITSFVVCCLMSRCFFRTLSGLGSAMAMQ